MASGRRRLRMELRGAVQGVGFRPYVFRLAGDLGLHGWVSNDARGVLLEVEGEAEAVERFRRRLPAEKPPPSSLDEVTVEWLNPAGLTGFRILASEQGGPRTALLVPDLATCPWCLAEVEDSKNRRFGYPFTNCIHCGPRFTIIRGLPYDRARTTMDRFRMCRRCQDEYETPANRRFHAQPNACPSCGPELRALHPDGRELCRDGAALQAAAAAIRSGSVVAVKGLGGFHLMVDARDGDAIGRLRSRKPRREKPLALMARDLEQARQLCFLGPDEAAALASPEAPIILARRRPDAPAHPGVAPGNPYLGVMLPFTPLHHLLLRSLEGAVVATSGNLSEEPVCIDEAEAVQRLQGVADLFLVHDRPIARHADDSIARTMAGRVRILRRARGFAPRPVRLDRGGPTVLAVGPELKNAVALRVGQQVFLSQHIGDMQSREALAAFERVVADFLRMYDARPVVIVHDLHPDYASTHWAADASAGLLPGDGPGGLAALRGVPLLAVQHHHAHLASCLADNGEPGPALGVTWDGTGYGPDGTVWGGEFLLGSAAGFRRFAHLRPFRLPGGEAAVREPRRSAVALLWEVLGEQALERGDLPPLRGWSAEEKRLLRRMLAGGVRSPWTTSAGRLFDGVAALLGLHPRATFEGQAAMAVEFLADPAVRDAYPVELRDAHGTATSGPEVVLDWGPLLASLLEDLRAGVPRETIAARFHNGLATAIVRTAGRAGEAAVALTGGCFQNLLLLERAAEGLRRDGRRVLLHRQVPANDGGISLGQVAVAAETLRRDG